MARMIRGETRDGAELVEFALRVWRGEVDGMDSEKSRMWAHDWLTDRAIGKPLQSVDMLLGAVEITPEQQAALEALKLSPHERRERIAELKARARSSTP